MASVFRPSLLVVHAAVVLAFVVVSLSAPAKADPTLFTGDLLQSGGFAGTVVPQVTAPGPTAAAPGIASNTTGGGFTIPSAMANPGLNQFYYYNPGYTFSIPPVYPYIYLKKKQYNEAGNFENSYFAPGVATTKVFNSVSTNVFPNIPAQPRNATVRLVPGANGLGGPMTIRKDQSYVFHVQGPVYLYQGLANRTIEPTTAPFGRAELTPASVYGTKRVAQMTERLIHCCETRIIGSTGVYPTVVASAHVAEAVGPWATGMLYVNDAIGPDATVTTETATDARTAFNSGVISMVTPRVQFAYSADGTNTNTLLQHNETISSIHKMTLNFVPEPGAAALLCCGALGLLGLARLRRRG